MKQYTCQSKINGGNKVHFFLLYVILTTQLQAYNLLQLSNKDGLSNSAILSMCQDRERFIWIGTADGLNLYNGIDIKIFKPGNSLSGHLSGNLIEEIWESEQDIIWINTNHGLNRFNKKSQHTEQFNEFKGKYYCAQTSSNDFFVIYENDYIHYFNRDRNVFTPIDYPWIKINDIRKIFIDSNNVLWVITNKGIVHNCRVSFDSETPEIESIENNIHDNGIHYAFLEKESIYFIDNDHFLFEIDLQSGKKYFITDLKKEIDERGVVSSILKDNDDFLVAFQTNGLIRIQNTPENAIKYQIKSIDIYCGVFCLLKDEQQDIIWIGTDGQGLYMHTRDLFSIRSVTFESLPYTIRKPIRAIHIDNNKNLWIGTKDDGILLISKYDSETGINSQKTDYLTTFNSELINNSIYAFGKSRRNLLWIGGDGPGLNYYSYKEKKIKKILSPDNEPIRYVHNICEVNDTTLWLSSVGAGIYKVLISGSEDLPVIKSVKRFSFIKDEMSYNFFFTACQENDSIIWFGNRGYGLRRLNLHTEIFEHILFSQNNIQTINDILSLFRDRNGCVWAGTSYGLVKILNYDTSTQNIDYINFNEIEGLPNNTIHGIQEDGNGHLWVSTNDGLVRFDTEAKKFYLHNSKNGLNVFEFSDGASMKDEQSNTLFFGGINGFVSIVPDGYEKREFIPEMFFTGLRIYEKEYNINDFTQTYQNIKQLHLKYDQNFFTISFIALDYINGQNCKYYYNLENFSAIWIENGHSNHANFTNISPGKYVLHVKCDNSNVVTGIYSLPIVILPPWYLTRYAYITYILIFLFIIYYATHLVKRRYRRKRERMIAQIHQQQKEELYESKLRFFTNITHEFATPLTLIYGPCNRIISYEKTDHFIKKYAGMIMKNTERLYSLIQELIEFRRIETGHKECFIERLNISEISSDIMESFAEFVEIKNIDYQSQIDNNLIWNTDKSCFTKILINLLSNAFKYTPDYGKILVAVCLENDLLHISVSNTGKGIDKKDIPYIFDRYRVLENLDKQTQKGFFSRNGLGLAICHNMVRLLNGDIRIESIPERCTVFHVTLPEKEITPAGKKLHEELSNQTLSTLPWKNDIYKTSRPEPTKLTVLIIDDDPEMCWFISEFMSEKYHVITVENPLAVPYILESIHPQLIVSDIMMPGIDGISLMKKIKSDYKTAHIPFILLSAKNTPEEQTEGINAGADAYVVKPFNIDYFKSIVERLLKRQYDLKDYYNSPLSAYEFNNSRFVHKDSKSLFEKLVVTIDRNKHNPDFSSELLARELGLSLRNLYRKLKEITDESPASLIKEYKLATAEKLLKTSKHSIDEIMFMSGFINRGSFYKLFEKKYSMTPKKYRESKIDEIRI